METYWNRAAHCEFEQNTAVLYNVSDKCGASAQIKLDLFCWITKDWWIKSQATIGVNEELNAIYSVIEKTQGLKAPAIALILGVSLSTSKRYIKKLKDAIVANNEK